MTREKKSNLGQNFTIVDGKIVKNGNELPVRKGVTSVLLPEIRKNIHQIPRWFKGSFLNKQESTDENYQKDNHIA